MLNKLSQLTAVTHSGMTAHAAVLNEAPESFNPDDDNQLQMIFAGRHHPQENILRFQKDQAEKLKKYDFVKLRQPKEIKRDNNVQNPKPKKTTDIQNHLEITMSKRDNLPDMTVREDTDNFNEVKHVRLDSVVHKVDIGVNGKPQKVQMVMKVGFDPETAQQIRRLTRVLEDLNEGISSKVNEVNEDIEDETVRDGHRRNKRSAEVTKYNNKINVTVELADDQNKTVDNGNSTIECNGTSGCRRSFSSDLQISSAIKTRLLSYILEYFNDITKKITSLKNVKNTFAADDEYNIGYMIANIDMLEVNLRNLKAEMEAHKLQMGEKQILDLFDKVKVSNGVVSSLLTALKSIVDRHTERQGFNLNQYQIN